MRMMSMLEKEALAFGLLNPSYHQPTFSLLLITNLSGFGGTCLVWLLMHYWED